MDVDAGLALADRNRRIELCSALISGPADAAAETLDRAGALGIDPLEYCLHHLKLNEAQVLHRAATWVGLRFAPEVPHTLRGSAPSRRLDSIADVRTIHVQIGGQELHFFAPHFDDLIRLRQRRDAGAAFADRICLVPLRAIRRELVEANAGALLSETRQRLARRWPKAGAHLDLPMWLRLGFVAILALAVLFTALAPFLARPLLVPFLLLVIVLPAMLRLCAVLIRPSAEPPDPPLPDADLPRYTVLIPLRDEAHMVPQLQSALRALDYPPDKLEVIFIVEQRSPETILAVEAILDDPRFELVVVPDALPHTKPKALDYVLPLVRGAHLVVYDAEDLPARSQLRLAAARFAAKPELDCLQAELVIDNGAESWLTALFAGEYAGLFGLLLPLLARWGLPMPLGGTSNHFRTAALRDVGGWDAFNVTEDADLGVRLARLHLRTGTLRSPTLEEAPIDLGAWTRQRTRWMKGWMQTFLVHNRHPLDFLRQVGWRGFLFFQIHVGSLIVSSLLHTVFVLTLALQIALLGLHAPAFTNAADLAYLAVFVIGYGGAFGLAIAGLVRQKQVELAVYQLLLPVYWLLHAMAASRAAIELIVRPYFWSKTRHGRTRMQRGSYR